MHLGVTTHYSYIFGRNYSLFIFLGVTTHYSYAYYDVTTYYSYYYFGIILIIHIYLGVTTILGVTTHFVSTVIGCFSKRSTHGLTDPGSSPVHHKLTPSQEQKAMAHYSMPVQVDDDDASSTMGPVQRSAIFANTGASMSSHNYPS